MMNEEKTRYDEVIGFLKNNPFFVILMLVFVVITALATLTSSIGTLKGALFGNSEDAPLTATPVEDVKVFSSGSDSTDESLYHSDRRYLPMTLKQYHDKYHDTSLTEYQRLAMTKDYLGRIVVWEGYIFDITTVYKFTDDIGLSIKPEPEPTLGLTFVEFDEAYSADFKNIKKGQKIRFTGTIADKRDPGPLIVDTTLLRVYDPEEDPDLTTEPTPNKSLESTGVPPATQR